MCSSTSKIDISGISCIKSTEDTSNHTKTPNSNNDMVKHEHPSNKPIIDDLKVQDSFEVDNEINDEQKENEVNKVTKQIIKR